MDKFADFLNANVNKTTFFILFIIVMGFMANGAWKELNQPTCRVVSAVTSYSYIQVGNTIAAIPGEITQGRICE